MANVIRALTLSNAAALECARAHHETVDVDHLYLGLLASGGGAARVLGANGITLPSARTASRAVRRADAGYSALDAQGDPASTPIPVDDLHYHVMGDLPWTERASALGPTPTARKTDLTLLADLIDEDSGFVRRILAKDGADPDAVRAHVEDVIANGSEPTPQNQEDSGEFLPDDATASAVTLEHYLAEPVESVWESVCDPQHVIVWAGSPETSRVVAGGVETTFDRMGHAGHTRLDPVLVEEPSAEGARVVWQERHFSDKLDGEPGGYYDLRLRREAEGTLLTVVRGIRTFGTFGRALLPIARRTTAASLGTVAQDIAYASARS